MTTTQSTLDAIALEPILTVNDLQKSIRFYEGLGFGIDQRWEEEGKLLGVMLCAGKARLSMSQDDFAKGRDRMKGVGFRIWITTEQDIDELAAKSKSNGVKLDGEPGPVAGGARGFTVTDPDGFKVTITLKE